MIAILKENHWTMNYFGTQFYEYDFNLYLNWLIQTTNVHTFPPMIFATEEVMWPRFIYYLTVKFLLFHLTHIVI